MTTSADLYADARKHMVDSQVRPNRVSDPRILAAMRQIPRERFLPSNVQALAYADEDVPLGNGRYMTEPMVLARMLQAAPPRADERVLIVAAGTGYSAAVLSACGCRVVALEDDPALCTLAQTVLAEQAPSVTVVTGPVAAGWAASAPYDLILIEGAVPEIPAALKAQLHQEQGRLVAAICAPDRATHVVLAEATPAGLGMTTLFDCGTPPLPSLKKAAAFEF